MVPSLLTLHKALQSRDSAKVAIIPDHLADFYEKVLESSVSLLGPMISSWDSQDEILDVRMERSDGKS